jgi:ABC-type branched-subunit amino acid transport system ATPase component
MQKIQIINQTFNITIVLVEQNIKNALEITDKILILTNGQLQVEYEEPQKFNGIRRIRRDFLFNP